MFSIRTTSLLAALLLGSSALSGAVIPGSAQAQAGGTPVQLAQASGVVLDIQRELNRLGYNAGPEDGLMGARTRGAIQAYQRDNNLLVDGQATSALLSHVRDRAQAAPPAASQTPAPRPQAGQAPTQPVGALPRLVSETQRALRTLGYDIGPPTGRLDEGTRSAIRTYEMDHGLLVTSEPSEDLLEHMRQRIAGGPSPDVSTDTVAGIQAELRRRGHPIPLVTGRMDAQTRQAIREYQQGRGLQVTGEPSVALLEELGAARVERPADADVTREQRIAAQRALNQRGYNAGPPDGVLNPVTRTAIRTFQADNELQPTGELTAQTLETLGIAAVADPPPVAAGPAVPADPTYRVRLQDDFADGDYTTNPTWRIASGTFEVRNGGLTSVMAAPSTRPEDVGRQLLGSVLQSQLGVAIPGQANAAVAYVPTRISESFRITAELSGTTQTNSQVSIGPYLGPNLGHGYRLSYRANQPRPLQLLVVDQGGTSVIGSAAFNLDSGGPHRLTWQRNPDGRMTVTRDSEMVIDVIDRTVTGGFDGFSLVNAGGEWTLHEVMVENRE